MAVGGELKAGTPEVLKLKEVDGLAHGYLLEIEEKQT